MTYRVGIIAMSWWAHLPNGSQSLDSPELHTLVMLSVVCGLALRVQAYSCSSIKSDWEKGHCLRFWTRSVYGGWSDPLEAPLLCSDWRDEPWLPHNGIWNWRNSEHATSEYIPLANWLFWTESTRERADAGRTLWLPSSHLKAGHQIFHEKGTLLVWRRKAHSYHQSLEVSGKTDLRKPSNISLICCCLVAKSYLTVLQLPGL